MARIHHPIDTHTTTSIPSIDHRLIVPPTNNLAAKPDTLITIPARASRGKLNELSIGQIQNSIVYSKPPIHDQVILKPNCDTSELKSVNAKHSSRGLRRRTPIDPCIFEPLDVVQEESIVAPVAIDPASASTSADPGASTTIVPSDTKSPSPQAGSHEHPLLTAIPEHPIHYQIEKHLAGQFEWLLSYPVPVGSAKGYHTSGYDGTRQTPGTMVFGCNLLSRKQRSASQKSSIACSSANTYTLVATRLEGDAYIMPPMDMSQALDDQVDMALGHPPAYEDIEARGMIPPPIKIPEVEIAEVMEQAVSPSLTFVSDRSSSYAGGSSRAGSFSVPRIEDSLEEIDKLEEELEAVNAVAQPGRITSPEEAPPSLQRLELPPDVKTSSVTKRASMSGLSSTVRIKQSEKTAAPLRRTTSLVFRNKKDEPQEASKLKSQLSRGQLSNPKPAAPKPPVKSTKAPTVPNFELPGEAVSRRLKEQREARLAQQAETRPVYVPPPRPKSNKPLTKPNFELPGEAISRRKREEREVRLKAQEEEERKKREFKARPARFSTGPTTLPRETITSRIRQGKPAQEDDAERRIQERRLKRYSLGTLRPSPSEPVDLKRSQPRGRLSTAVSDENLSRGTSVSTGGSLSKRHSISAEEMHQLRMKGKEIFERENSSLSKEREREKRERETAARVAREQAAERSRAASREWAEKKRRREQAMRESMKQMANPVV